MIRHAATLDLDRRLSGRTPGVGLSELGRGQCAGLVARVAALAPARLVASPLERTQETAHAVSAATGLPVETDERLTEIDFGDWAGRDFASLHADPAWQRWNAERANARPPGGESMAQAQARVVAALDDHAAGGGTVALVSHADCIKAAVCAVLALSLDRFHRFDVAPASVTRLSWNGGDRRVMSINEGGI